MTNKHFDKSIQTLFLTELFRGMWMTLQYFFRRKVMTFLNTATVGSLLKLIFGCLFFVVCLDFDVVHCASPDSIDYKTLVELTKNSLQSTDNESFVKKAEQILGRPLASVDVVRLLESKIESDDQARSLFSKFSDLPKSQKLIVVVGLVCFCYTMSSLFLDPTLMITNGEDLSATNGSLSSTTESVGLGVIGQTRLVSRLLKIFGI